MPKVLAYMVDQHEEITESEVMASKIWRGLAVHRSIDPRNHRKWVVVTFLQVASLRPDRRSFCFAVRPMR